MALQVAGHPACWNICSSIMNMCSPPPNAPLLQVLLHHSATPSTTPSTALSHCEWWLSDCKWIFWTFFYPFLISVIALLILQHQI
jgi:hypothetical protein